MVAINRVAIVGAGAVGAAYGSMLYECLRESVFFIADRERYVRLKSDGVVVNGHHYPISVYRPEEVLAPVDLLIFCVKHHHLHRAITDVRGAVGEKTTILSFLNGIESEDTIGSQLGHEKVLYSMVLGIDAVRTNNSITYSNQGRVFFGEATNTIRTERVMAVEELFQRAGIGYVIPYDMIRTLWWKFMINVGINQVSAALRAPYEEFQKPGKARSLMDAAMREVMALANIKGIDLGENDILQWHDVLTKLSPRGRTSMLQDIDEQRKTEVEMFAGRVIQLGRAFGVPTPTNDYLFRCIRLLEDENSSVTEY